MMVGGFMKYNRIISFTIINAFVLLGFASFLSGCEKKSFPGHGYFSKSDNKRSVASVETKPFFKEFFHFQDPQQINIYCQLNRQPKEQCYNENMRSSLAKFQEKFGEISPTQQENLIKKYPYDQIQSELNIELKKIADNLVPQINKWVNKRFNFCKQHSKYFLKKCIKQSMEKDTFSILNQFHKKHKMNGQEYLLVKKTIKLKMKNHISELTQMNHKPTS